MVGKWGSIVLPRDSRGVGFGQLAAQTIFIGLFSEAHVPEMPLKSRAQGLGPNPEPMGAEVLLAMFIWDQHWHAS